MAFDGDMAQHVVPADDVKQVLADPLAFHALTTQEKQHNPNRFFSHWAMFQYFNKMPKLLRHFTTPIEAIYLSAAIFKTMAYAALLFLLAFAVSGSRRIWDKNFLLAAALLAPLFQANGYANFMAVVDRAPTYTFFYSIPCIFMLVYLLPLISEKFHGAARPQFSWIKWTWPLLAFVVCLSGPLNPGIVFVLVFVLFLEKIWSAGSLFAGIKSIPKSYYFCFVPLLILSAYSLFIGQSNSMNEHSKLPLAELYARLPTGFFSQFTQKLGFPLLFLAIAVNWFLLKKSPSQQSSKTLKTIKWALIFCLFFILLLPLGGQRPYRPNVLRYDTIMPVTLVLMFVFGLSSLFLLKNLGEKRRWYLPFWVTVLAVFMLADAPDFHQNDCEKSAIYLLSNSTENPVALDCDCPVLVWGKNENPADSEAAAWLLKLWEITDEPRQFFYKNQK